MGEGAAILERERTFSKFPLQMESVLVENIKNKPKQIFTNVKAKFDKRKICPS